MLVFNIDYLINNCNNTYIIANSRHGHANNPALVIRIRRHLTKTNKN